MEAFFATYRFVHSLPPRPKKRVASGYVSGVESEVVSFLNKDGVWRGGLRGVGSSLIKSGVWRRDTRGRFFS